jgi:hypothetical protein
MKALAMAACLTLLCACEAATGGELVPIDLSLGADPEFEMQAHSGARTQTGWTVILHEAKLAVASALVYAPREGPSASLRALLFGRALAHGGYDPFNNRRVRVEYKGPVTLDLVGDAPLAIAELEAETGALDSATWVFATLEGTSAQAWARGTARRGEEEVTFEGFLTMEEGPLLRRVDGIPVDGELRTGGTLELRVNPLRWFDEAHFDRLARSSEGPRQITRDSQVHTAWLFSVRSSKTYAARWQAP